MGKAFYRKYRSSSLDEVVGQKHITDTLKNALKKGAISHAYLFTGPRGVGKTSVARILAHEVNGLKYDENVTQLDIIEIDAASNRRIDEIRDLRDKVHIAPTSSKYKVYIIDEVHMLTREAFNALLKTLEEPPEHAIFILATTEANKVPDTIISRTQRYSFRPITNEDAMSHLRVIADKEKLNISDDALKLIVNHGRGSFRDSISMLDQLAGFDNNSIDASEVSILLGIPSNQLLKELIRSVSDKNTVLLFDSIRKLKEQGSSPTNIAQSLIDLLRNQINSGDKLIEDYKSVAIMKTLLDSTGSNGSYEQIEIALLESIDFDTNSETVYSENKHTIKKDPETTISSEEIVTVEIDSLTDSIQHVELLDVESQEEDQLWNDILLLVKSKHNTLYGVLRMADAQILDGKIVLTFKFDFHKKQLLQNKNLDVLHGVIIDSLGKKHDLELIVKKPTKVAPKQLSKEPSKILSSVSNIFGDAELLE